MAETAPLDPRLTRIDGRLCWRIGDRLIPLIAGGDDGDPPPQGATEGSGETPPAGEPDGGETTDSGLPEGVREVLRKERAAARQATRERDTLAARLKEIEDRDKTEAERNREAAETATKERDEARSQLIRERVARRLQVPDALVDRLRGGTEEALEEDAKSLLGAITAREPNSKRPAGPPARDGNTPETPSLDQQITAAEKAGDWTEAIRLKSRLASQKET